MLLQGKRIVVTGASRGLGRAFATAVAREGASIVINGTNAEKLAETASAARASGGDVHEHVGSVASYAACEELIDMAVQRMGGIDVLVNNAGIVRDRTLLNMSEEEFDEVIAVNLKGTWACGKLAAAAMKAQGKGQILNVISNSGLRGAFGQTNYAASKGGVMGMTFSWALELARYGIRCNAIWPVAQTDMTDVVLQRAWQMADREGKPRLTPREMGLGQPEEVAAIVVYLCLDETDWLNGQIITFNGSKVALWTHPAETNVQMRDSWTVEDFRRDFQRLVVPAQEPVGHSLL
jgi:3-oxoacyl-[acyl-carrier protein] reductase